jgi:microcin C transport system ATP-binding protein
MTDAPNTGGKPPLLEIRNLSVSFGAPGGGKGVQAVKGSTFDIPHGRIVALVGESGSGKSVTAHSILRLLPYPAAQHGPESAIKFEGRDMLKITDSEMRGIRGSQVAMIFQEPSTSLNPLHRIEKQIAEPLILHKGLTREQARPRVIELLKLVGLEEDIIKRGRLGAYPHELSGGQKQRVMIAMALANEPKLLIADEPTTALDVTVQAQVLELMQDLQKKMGMSILLITHDLNVVRKMADYVCVMKDGEIVEQKDAKALFANPQHAYTKMLLASKPSGAPKPVKADAPTVVKAENMQVWFGNRGVLTQKILTSRFNRAKERITHDAEHHPNRLHRFASKALRGTFRKVSTVKAVDGIDFEIRAGETLGVVGESGSGKSTLGFATLALQGKTGGRVLFLGRDLDSFSAAEKQARKRNMQIVFQDPFGSLSPRMSVGDIIGEGLSVHFPKLTRDQRDEKVCAIMREVGLPVEMRHRYPHECSGGQRQRISIARAMILEPQFVLLDEPTSALDLTVQTQVINLLRGLQEKHNLAFMFISHDMAVVRAMSHKVMVMKHGRVVEAGPTEEIFKNPQQEYTRELIAAAMSLTARKPGAAPAAEAQAEAAKPETPAAPPEQKPPAPPPPAP